MAKEKGSPAVLKTLGENIARVRGKRNQSSIAEASGIDISTISDLENGRRNPSYTTLVQLAGALGVGVVDLVSSPKVGVDPLEKRIAALEKALLKGVPAKPKRKR